MTEPEISLGWGIEPKAELGPAARIVHGACAANQRFARRAAEVDTGAPGQSLLGHGDAVPACGSSRRR